MKIERLIDLYPPSRAKQGAFMLGVMGALVVAATTLLSACSRKPDNNAATERLPDKQLDECRKQLGRNPVVPIIGGGRIDTRRFDLGVSTVRLEDGECGTDGFQASFYWTGERIVPTGAEATRASGGQIPESWSRFNVAARLGNQRLAKACAEKSDANRCGDVRHKNPGLPTTWPADRIIRLKAYPGLEIWLPPNHFATGSAGISFVIRGWPRDDGVTPRTIYCWSLPKTYSLDAMSATDFADINFSGTSKNGYPCDVEPWDFKFKGGAARVGTSTASLASIGPALRALQQYISESIDQEE